MRPYNRFHMTRFSIDSLIYSNYIKYDRLRELIINEFRGSPDENCVDINIFIDTYSFMKNAYHRDDFMIDDGQEYALASGVINMAAHYRSYFNTRHGVNTKIYIVSSFNYNNNLIAINPRYQSQIDLDGPKMDYFINNIKALDSIVQFLPNMYFKHYDFTSTSAAILDIIKFNSSIGNNNPNIVITKDILNYQLVNVRPNRVVVLRPKKVYSESDGGTMDVSYIINRNNLMETLSLSKHKQKTSDEKTLKSRCERIRCINPELFSVFLALSGCAEYGYRSLLSFASTTNILYSLIIEDGKILNQYNHNTLDLFRLVSECSKKNIDITEAENRFRTMDSIYLYDSMQAIGIETMKKEPKSIYAPEAIKEINNKLFKDYPLDLNVL